jgi:hypothetical protein
MIGLPQEIIEVLEKESNYESEPWLFESITLCGVEVNNLTLRHVLILDGVNNPVLSGESVDVDTLAVFLWVISKEFELGNNKVRDKFLEKISTIDYIKLLQAVKGYVEGALSHSRAMTDDNKKQKKPNAHFVAYVIDSFASNYSWDINYIMSLPLAIIHQLIAVINERICATNDEPYSITRESDKLINRHIRKNS